MFKPTIGLEIHIELNTKSKMFCSCKNDSLEKEPNLNICPICTAQPGTLPVINKEAVKKLLKTALALNCKISKNTFFERKNYFYPDLPKGYQISQYASPLSKNGYLAIKNGKKIKKIKINRIHLEEDTGKLIHPEGKDYSLVDFNRAGIPLMELVTEPDIESSEDAGKFAKELQLILRYLGVSKADMEKGQMRCEVNISIHKPKEKFGTKVEIKNLNSLRTVEKSIEYEIKRQIEALKNGEKIIQETRGWHDTKEITFSQREKEESHDYRYFPEPDLPPLELDDVFIKEIKAEIPELPEQRRKRFKKEYGLDDAPVEVFITQKGLGEYFEKVVSELQAWFKDKELVKKISKKEFKKIAKLASNYIASDLQALLKEKSEFIENKFPVSPENFAEFISMVYSGQISSKIAKTLLSAMFESGQDPSQLVEDRGLKLITDKGQIDKVVQEVISANQKAVEDYKKGKQASLQFLVGQVMAKTKGTAKPEQAIEILKKLLGSN